MAEWGNQLERKTSVLRSKPFPAAATPGHDVQPYQGDRATVLQDTQRTTLIQDSPEFKLTMH